MAKWDVKKDLEKRATFDVGFKDLFNDGHLISVLENDNYEDQEIWVVELKGNYYALVFDREAKRFPTFWKSNALKKEFKK